MKYMMLAWATFVRDPASGLESVLYWPRYDPQGNTLVRLGYNNSPGPSFVDPCEFNEGCPSIGSVIEAQGAF